MQCSCEPYWNDYCAEISSQLSSPTETASAASGSSIWSNPTVENSWFSPMLRTLQGKNSQKIFSASPTSSLVECMDFADIIRRSKKIRVYPTTPQKQLFGKWFGVQRFVYNKTVEYLKNIDGPRPPWMGVAKEVISELPDFCKPVPYQIKKIAVRDACVSFSMEKKKTKETGKSFSQKFRSRKNPRQSCYIPKSSVLPDGIYPRISGKLRYSEALPNNIHDSRFVFYSGRYYLTVPYEKKTIRAENQGRVVAIDPGVRSFITFYSETSFGHLGTHDIGRIQRLCEHLDKLMSRIASADNRRQRRMRRAADRMRWKIRDLVDELHHKAARFLVDNFDIILLPTFETQKMSVKKARKLRKKSVRQMLNWAHYRFKQFLKHKSFETGKLVMDVCEAYTSKTNSWTGEIMPKLGGREWITVDGLRINRDVNGARGIFLRALVDSPALKACVVNES